MTKKYVNRTDDLIETLINSTFAYTYERICNKKDKEAYTRGMQAAAKICHIHFDRLDEACSILKDIAKNPPRTFWQHFEVFSDTNYYFVLAMIHCLDIVQSIYKRFVVGYSSPDDIFIKNIIRRSYDYKNKSFFREIQRVPNICSVGSRRERE